MNTGTIGVFSRYPSTSGNLISKFKHIIAKTNNMDGMKIYGGYIVEYRNKKGEKDAVLIEAKNKDEAIKQAKEEYGDEISEILDVKRLYRKFVIPGWVVPPKEEGLY